MRDATKGARDKPDYTRVVEFVLPTEKVNAISIMEIQNRTGLTHKQVEDAISQLADRGAKIRRTSGLLGIKKYYKVGAVNYADNIQQEALDHKLGRNTGIIYRHKENEIMINSSTYRDNDPVIEYATSEGNAPKWIRAIKEYEKQSALYCKDCGKRTHHIYGAGSDNYVPLCRKCMQKRQLLVKINKAMQ